MRRILLLCLAVLLVVVVVVVLRRGGSEGAAGGPSGGGERGGPVPLEVAARAPEALGGGGAPSDPPAVEAVAADSPEAPLAGAESAPPAPGPVEVAAQDPVGTPSRLKEGWARLEAKDVVAAEAAFAGVVESGAGRAAVESARDGLALVALLQGDRSLAEKRLAEDSERRPSRLPLVLSVAEDDLRRGDAPGASLRLTRGIETAIAGGAAFAELEPISQRLEAVNRDLVFNPRGTWRSESVEVASGDSWYRIAKRLGKEKGLRIGIGLLQAVNRRSGDHLDVGEVLRVPIDPIRIDIHRSAFACLVYLGDRIVRVYPVGLGREGSETPVGRFEIGKKDPRPIWWKPNPPGPPLPYGHPDNPLGERWIGFRADGQDTEYGIHGTNSEDAILARVSNGCVRLRNEDVVALYDLIPDSGTPVAVY